MKNNNFYILILFSEIFCCCSTPEKTFSGIHDVTTEKFSNEIFLDKCYQLMVANDTLFFVRVEDFISDINNIPTKNEAYIILDNKIVFLRNNIDFKPIYSSLINKENVPQTIIIGNQYLDSLQILDYRKGFRGSDYGSQLTFYLNDKIKKINYPKPIKRHIHSLAVYKNELVIVSDRDLYGNADCVARFFSIDKIWE